VKRILTAAAGIPLLLGLIFWGPPLAFRLAMALVALLCLSEFLKLAAQDGARPMRLAAYLAAAWVVAAEITPGPLFFLGVTLLLLTLAMRGGREVTASLPGAGATLLGIVYTAIPFRLAADLAAPDKLFPLPFRIPLLDTDAFNLLPILMMVVMIVQQKLAPKPTDEQQAQMQKMMSFMVIFMGFLFYGLPAGLVLYFLTSSLIGIAEQRWIKARLERAETAMA
jgi:hypothetical protein